MNGTPLFTPKALIAIFLSTFAYAFFVPIPYLWMPEACTGGNVLFLIAIVELGAFASVSSSLKIMNFCVFSKNSYFQKKSINHSVATPTAKKIEISVSAFWAATCLLAMVWMEKHSLQHKELWRSIALFLSLWLTNLYACATLGRFLRPKLRSSTVPLAIDPEKTSPTLSQFLNAQQLHNQLHTVFLQQTPDCPYPVMIGVLRRNTSTLKNYSLILLMIVYMGTGCFIFVDLSD